MSTNRIDQVRAEVRKYFDPSGAIAGGKVTHVSPSGHFRIETQTFKQNRPDRAWEVMRVEVFAVISGERLFEFIATYSRFFFTWIEASGRELLICAEDAFGGQTVIDLTNRKMSSYSPNMDGFIWTEHFLSPDEKRLAVCGCIWGAPYWVNVYDFSSPFELPLPLLQEIDLDDNLDEVVGWSDSHTLRFRGQNKEERFIQIKQQPV